MGTLKLQNDASIDFTWYHKMKNDPNLELSIMTRDLNPDMVHAILSVGSRLKLYVIVSGYAGTIVEPNTKEMDAILETAIDLIQKGFSKDHLILMIDPIITTKKGLKRADEVFYQFRGVVDHVIVAPMILYPIMKKRFKEAGIKMPPGITIKDFNSRNIPEELVNLVEKWKKEFQDKNIEILSSETKNTIVQSSVQCFFQCPHCYCQNRNIEEERIQSNEILLK